MSADELRFVLTNLPVRVSNIEINEIMEAADLDGDGKISFAEFRQLVGM